MMPACRILSRPVTTNARLPHAFAIPGSSAMTPGPKTIRPALVNSKRIPLPGLVAWKNSLVPGTRARLRHHVGHRLGPLRVMGCALMRFDRLLIVIDLPQAEPVRIIAQLQKIESRNPGLLRAVTRILDRDRAKLFQMLRFDVNVHVKDRK